MSMVASGQVLPQVMEPIDSSTVVDRIINQITNAVVNRRFIPGERLPSEFELMSELKVSRNSLREAIKILSALGLLEIKRGDGTYVCEKVKPNYLDSAIYSIMMEASTEEEIVELRLTIDEDMLTLAMKKCSDSEIDDLQLFIESMRDAFRQGDISLAAKLDFQFHLYLADIARNSFLKRISHAVYQLFESSIEKNIRSEEDFALADQHHQEIVDCLKSRDPSTISSVVARSLSSWRRNIRQKTSS